MPSQNAAYTKLIAKLPASDQRFIVQIDHENAGYAANSLRVTRSGFMQDLAKRDRLVSDAAKL